MKLILCDVDGVLLNWTDGFRLFMESKGYPQKVFTAYGISSSFDITTELANTSGQEFNESDALQSLLPITGAKSGVDYLYHNGCHFIAITSVGNSEKVKKSRIKNLENVFGKGIFKDVICLPFIGDKKKTLSKWKDTNLPFIEDKWENAKDGFDLGLDSIILDYPYNRYFFRDKYSTIKRAQTWPDIVNFVTTL